MNKTVQSITLTATLLAPLTTLDAADQRPNILLIMADNWSWPHAGLLGDRLCKTPAFDQLARDGVLSAHAFPQPAAAGARRDSVRARRGLCRARAARQRPARRP